MSSGSDKSTRLSAWLVASLLGTVMPSAAAEVAEEARGTETTETTETTESSERSEQNEPTARSGKNGKASLSASRPQTASAAPPVHELPTVEVTASQTGQTGGFSASTVETGPYRGIDALDVPATINVVTRDVIDAQGDTTLFDALRNVAGVSRRQLNGVAYDNLSVRGIALDNRSSYYFNGVLPFNNLVWIPMQDKERVEVLKGASALYYGFAAPAGIVNLVMKRAEAEPVTRVSLLGDANGSYGMHADIGRRFGTSDQFGLRVNAMSEHVEAPIDGDRGYRQFASAALDWRVTRALKLQYDFEQIDTRIVEQAGIALLPPDRSGTITLPALPDPTRLLSGRSYPTYASATSQLLRATYSFSDDWNATLSVGESTTRRDRWQWVFRKYNTATGAGTLTASRQPAQRYRNANLRLETNGLFTTGPLQHDLTLGASFNGFFQPGFATTGYSAAQNLYRPVEITTLKPDGTKRRFNDQHVRNSGAYAFDRIDLGTRWMLIAGVRYSNYTTSQSPKPDTRASGVTPSASLSYRLAPHTSVYASYIEALESAGSAPVIAHNAYEILPAVVSRQYEAGIRTEFAQTLLSLSAFNLRQPSAGLDRSNIYVLDGTTRYRGIEFSMQGDIARDVSIAGSTVLLNAKQIEASDPALLGKTPENTPAVTASLFAEYRVPGVPGLSVNGGMYYTARRAVNDSNQADIGGYTLFAAGLRYSRRVYGRRVTLQANLENATNKRYWNAAGSNLIGVGTSRTLGLSSTIEF